MRSLRIAVVSLAGLAGACQSDGPTSAVAGSESPTLHASQMAVVASISGSAHLTVFAPPTPPGLALRNFTVSAQQLASGEVRGQWQVVAGASILHGDIDCMTIADDARSARISGIVTDAKVTLFVPGTAFAMELFDNGQGAGDPADVTTQLRAFRNAAPEVGRAFCENGTVPEGGDLMPLPTEHGNFTIRVLPVSP